MVIDKKVHNSFTFTLLVHTFGLLSSPQKREREHIREPGEPKV